MRDIKDVCLNHLNWVLAEFVKMSKFVALMDKI